MTPFCLVHGSSQTAEGWKLLVRELDRRGHAAVTVDLPTDEPKASGTRYADVIVQTLDSTNHEMSRAVVVGHSASGVFLPLVAARRPIGRMVFLAAVVPKLGTSIIEQIQSDAEMLSPGWPGKNPMDDEVAREYLFHDCAPDVVEWALTTRALMYAQEAMTEVYPWSIVGRLEETDDAIYFHKRDGSMSGAARKRGFKSKESKDTFIALSRRHLEEASSQLGAARE